jgi:hypothetical protein
MIGRRLSRELERLRLAETRTGCPLELLLPFTMCAQDRPVNGRAERWSGELAMWLALDAQHVWILHGRHRPTATRDPQIRWAVRSAPEIGSARRDRCVLIDANPDRGTLGTSFARGHTVYVDDVRAAAERPDLSPSDLDGMLAHGPSGLRVLPAPQNSNRRRQLSADDYTAVIDCLRRRVGIIVIDLGTDMLEGPTVAALKAAHQLIVVSNDDWIAGEQTAASFWDDVRATSPAEYTIVANDITGSHRDAAERLHGQLTEAPAADSTPRSITVVSHNTTAYNKLQDRTVEWADLPRQWQRSARELAYRLAQDWPRLDLARP